MVLISYYFTKNVFVLSIIWHKCDKIQIFSKNTQLTRICERDNLIAFMSDNVYLYSFQFNT